MSFNQALDRYLTTPPDDGFTDYCDTVIGSLTAPFFEANEDWVLSGNTIFDKWVDRLHFNDVDPETAAKIIERAHGKNIHIKPN